MILNTIFLICLINLISANESNLPDLPPMPTLDSSNFELPKSVQLIKNLTDRTTRSSYFEKVNSKKLDDDKPLGKDLISSKLLINSMNAFTFKLFNYLMQKYSNIFISPISLYSSLIALHAASSGTTEAQLTKLLALSGVSDKQIASGYRTILDSMENGLGGLGGENELKILNTMLVDKKINVSSSYTDRMKTYYNMLVESVEFGSETEKIYQYVNNLVNWQTDGNIKSILDERPDPLSKLLLLNAVHFKGQWSKSFNPKDTTFVTFKNRDTQPSKVKLMKMVNEFKVYCDNSRQKGPNPPICSIKIPYAGEQLTMQIIQSANFKISLKESVERRMNAQLLQELEQKYSYKLVELGLPSFKIEDLHELREPMDFLGANSMFTKDRANLNKFLDRSSASYVSNEDKNDPNVDLFVNQFKHKASLAINEKGTVASAATSVLIGNRSGANKFIIDRPFILLIKDDQSGAILFIGRINNLEADNQL